MALSRVKRREIPTARRLIRPFRVETLVGKTRTNPIFGEAQRQAELLQEMRSKVSQFVNVNPVAAPLRRGEYVASHEQDYVGPGPREMNRHVVVVRRGGRSLPRGADPIADQIADEFSYRTQQVKRAEEKPYRDRVEVYALKDGKVLAGTYPDGGVGVYGGGVEPGETLEQAARREFKEEGGLKLKGLKPLDVKPLLEEWKKRTGLSAKEKERRKDFRGSRTFFFVADVAGEKGTPADTSPITRVMPRSLDTLIKREEARLDQAEDLVDRGRAEARLEVLEQVKEKTSSLGLDQAFAAISFQTLLKEGTEIPTPKENPFKAINKLIAHNIDEIAIQALKQVKPKQDRKKEKVAKEFAPGIPKERQVKPIPPVPHSGPNADWMVSLSKHPAARRGDHFDLRLVDEDGKAHSWALQDMPKPGQSTYAAQQPTHTGRYALRTEPFAIPTGVYGATRPGANVEPVYVQPAEVISANQDRVHFLRHHGQLTDEFVLRRVNNTSQGQVWALHNATKNRTTIEGQRLPDAKPKYKEVPFEKVDVNRPNQVMTAKIDGAHTLIDMPKAERMMRVYSYRPTVRETGLIEHTFKFPQFHERLVPPELKGTMIRAETWASKDGKAIPASELGGLLNSSVQKSRTEQAQRGVQMRLTGIDVVKFKGRDFSNKPYADKLDALRQVSKAMNGAIELPPMATTPEEKQKLLQAIKKKQLPETSEGVVIHKMDKAGPFIKAKVRPDFDVYVRDVFMKPRTEAKGQVGGFTYALEPDGPVVGRVGTGLSAQMRKEMFKNPDQFKGRVAKVQAQGQHQRRGEETPTGALIGSPAFKGWHLDKTDPDLMKSGEQVGPLAQPTQWVVDEVKEKMEDVPDLLAQTRYGRTISTAVEQAEQSPALRSRMKQILGRMRSYARSHPDPFPVFFDGTYYE